MKYKVFELSNGSLKDCTWATLWDLQQDAMQDIEEYGEKGKTYVILPVINM